MFGQAVTYTRPLLIIHCCIAFYYAPLASLAVVRGLTLASVLQTPTDAHGPPFTTEDARRVIQGRTPRFGFSPSQIHTASVGKEDAGRYRMRTLSWLMVPLLAVAVLGNDGAQLYFPPILPSLPGAQFSPFEVVAALRVVLQQNPGLMTENDIQPDPRDGSSLYFSESLQTALLDRILGLTIVRLDRPIPERPVSDRRA